MKILGRNVNDVIVQLTHCEWRAIGGAEEAESGYGRLYVPNINKPAPDILKLVKSLKDIQASSPDLKMIRATFQSFLMLTEPESIQAALDSCGVAEVLKEETSDE